MFYLYLKQSGEGCDYTIGCGETLLILESTNLQDAHIQAREKLYDYGADRIETATIFEKAHDLGWMIEGIKKAQEEESKQYKLQKKREQLEQLKKELGET